MVCSYKVSTQGDMLSINSNLHAITRELDRLYALNQAEMRSAFRKWRTKPSVDFLALPRSVYENAPCCFVLSTGRCGTKLLTKVLNMSNTIDCQHTPSPELVQASKKAYERIWRDRECFRLAISMARYDLVRDSYLKDLIYLETNNRITFFAPVLADIFRKAKFIHLVRHPGEFVRSGIRRGWYTEKTGARLGKIVLSDSHKWVVMSQIERISWLWNETNQFVERFKEEVQDQRRVFSLRAEELFSDPVKVQGIFEFLDVKPPALKRIKKVIKYPINIQKVGRFPKYKEWSEEQKDQLKVYATLAVKYGYQL